MSDTDAERPQNDAGAPKHRTLKLAGYVYVLGDACMYAAAHARNQLSMNRGKMIGAASWAVGGLGAGYFGDPGAEKQLELHAKHLEKYLRERGITIPEDVRAQSHLLHHRGLWEHVQDFLYEHPSEILNTGYLIGALTVLKDGLAQHKAGKDILLKGFSWKHFDNMNTSMWIGGLVLAGALGGLLIHENPHARKDEHHAKSHNPVSRVADYFREKPLRFSGLMYGLNNIFLAAMAKQDWDKSRLGGEYAGRSPYIYSTLQLASYIFANSMLMMSIRNQTAHGLAPQGQGELEDAAARIIAGQRPEMQQQLLGDVSAYLAKEKGITVDAGTLAQHLAERIGGITQERLAPAVTRAQWTAREEARQQTAADAPAQQLS